MIILRTAREIAGMRASGRIVARILREVADAASPGTRLTELDRLAAARIRQAGAQPSFLGYLPRWAPRPYPAVICLSVNDAIVHGIPTDRALRSGDVLSIDLAVAVDGLHADSAITIGIGSISEADQRLIAATDEALAAAIAASRVGARIGDVGAAVEDVARAGGFGIAEGLGGHGVGDAMHEDPSVPNVRGPGRGAPFRAGMVIALEPMLIAGGEDDHRTAADGWTILTSDRSHAAHAEHTVAVSDSGTEILTLP